MLIFNITVSEGKSNIISGVLDSASFNVDYTEDLHEDLITLQKELDGIEDIEVYEVWVESVKARIAQEEPIDTIVKACADLMLDTKTGNYYVQVEGKVSKHPVPEELVTVILESVDKNIDPTPIVKAWVRFLRNPNFTSSKASLFARYITTIIVDTEEVDRLTDEEGFTIDKAVDRAKYRDVTITNEGLIVAKKYARLLTEGWVIDKDTNEAVLEDLYKTVKTVNSVSGEVTETTAFPDFSEELTFEPPIMGRTGSTFTSCKIGDTNPEEEHVIKVGNVHALKSWALVDTRDDVSCVRGLHVGRICRLIM